MFPRFFLPLAGFALLVHSAGAQTPPAPEAPKPVDAQFTVQLVAQEPEIRTPTSVQVDSQGRIWALESNTHFRPKNYEGPPTDRILIFDQFAENGHAGRITVYAEGFSLGMSLRLLPGGDVIVSTRTETLRFHDKSGTGHGDERTTLLRIETTDTYPHNGLSSTAVGPDGFLYLGLGENHGAPWIVTGTDGATVSGTDEGAIFRCDLEGKHLERFALGFWNPFGLSFDRDGHLFVLDNDPGAGSLCRLLHVVRHGDFGYRYRYGRGIEHPFVSWFGEHRGYLPPLCLVGEAPVGLVQYRASAGMPFDGDLLGCTWGDHGVQRFHLEPKGASFATQPQWLLRGGLNFRPTGIAQAPDGSLVIGDWVEGGYEVHGKGRLWRLVPTGVPAAPVSSGPAHPPAEPKLQALLSRQVSATEALALLGEGDPYLVHGAIDTLAQQRDLAPILAHAADASPEVRLGVLLALRRSGRPEGQAPLAAWLRDPDGAVRRAALQWIGEEQLATWKDRLETALEGQPSSLTFQAYLSSLQLLASGKPDPKLTNEQTVQVALDPARPAELRALALRLAPIEHPKLPVPVLHDLLSEKDPILRREAARVLAARSTPEAQVELRRLAADATADAPLRAEALAGLAASAAQPESHATLRQALTSPEPALQREALRSLRTSFDAADAAALSAWLSTAKTSDPAQAENLRQLLFAKNASGTHDLESFAPLFATLETPRPAPDQPWPAVLEGQGDPAAGRRLFYQPNGPRCFTCHMIEGRGGAVGPDLTSINRLAPAALLEAIRQPSKDIAPAFSQWALVMRDGRVAIGIDQFADNKFQTVLMDATGKTTRYQNDAVVSREVLPVSIMPPGLDNAMTEQELRDLLAYLREPRD